MPDSDQLIEGVELFRSETPPASCRRGAYSERVRTVPGKGDSNAGLMGKTRIGELPSIARANPVLFRAALGRAPLARANGRAPRLRKFTISGRPTRLKVGVAARGPHRWVLAHVRRAIPLARGITRAGIARVLRRLRVA